jgi:2-C-methyl-D-erythritol 4-phosphate cytidylyltransferase
MTTERNSNWLVIPATGTGQRMGGDRPKQYLPLAGKTVIEITLQSLLNHPLIDGAVIVLNARDIYWSELNFQHSKPIYITEGGKERCHSVYNGLQHLSEFSAPDSTNVLIHDAVRPFVTAKDVDQLIAALDNNDDGVLLGAPVADTLKRVESDQKIAQTVDRERLWRAFTPQCFRLDLIMSALDSAISKSESMTDDASAMELAGYHPRFLKSSNYNLKITYPEDLILAAHLLSATDQFPGSK